MASIQKTVKGYRAQIKLAGDSDTFPTRREAVEWAARREAEIRDHATKPAGELHTLRQALRKYSDEVSPHRKGERWEQVRLAAFESYKLPLDLPMPKVTAQHVAAFRDDRARRIGLSSVLRELSLLASVFEAARLEWQWVEVNPLQGHPEARQEQTPRPGDRYEGSARHAARDGLSAPQASGQHRAGGGQLHAAGAAHRHAYRHARRRAVRPDLEERTRAARASTRYEKRPAARCSVVDAGSRHPGTDEGLGRGAGVRPHLGVP